ncbi:MAG: B12-binding domain-containing radical SAM protein, partial [Myxococcota bacterium]|nr:B12-binding domain-containing radical SAM protein [Myxococcota bacterium]
MSLQSIIENELMPQVEKPSRYIGSELNSVHKDPNEVSIRLALSFPDLYDIGLGNLGLHILYAILNKLDYCWAERTYAPGVDMERLLRERKLPMFTLESKTPLGDMDGIGFTLQSELTYTNILNMLDLAGIPLRTEDRTDSDPLTFCGGPAVFNPEPLVYFMDFFVFGDGEDIVVEIA